MYISLCLLVANLLLEPTELFTKNINKKFTDILTKPPRQLSLNNHILPSIFVLHRINKPTMAEISEVHNGHCGFNGACLFPHIQETIPFNPIPSLITVHKDSSYL